MSDRLGHRLHGYEICVLSHLAAPVDHGTGRTCAVCGHRVGRYTPVALCDIHRREAEAAGDEIVIPDAPRRTSHRTQTRESQRAAHRRQVERLERWRQLAREHGPVVYPDMDAETVTALLHHYVGQPMMTIAERLGWTENGIRSCTQAARRARLSHRLIPEEKCEQLTALLRGEVGDGT